MSRWISVFSLSCNRFRNRVGLNEQLQIVENTIAEEREKLLKALKVESRIQNNKNKASSLKQSILKSTELIRKQYNDFRTKISNTCSNIDNLKFIAQVEEKRDELFDAINSLFIKRGLLLFQKTYNYNLHIKEEFTVDDKLFECLWKAVDDDILQFKGGNDLTSFLEKIFSDWFYIHYIVKVEKTLSTICRLEKCFSFIGVDCEFRKRKLSDID